MRRKCLMCYTFTSIGFAHRGVDIMRRRFKRNGVRAGSWHPFVVALCVMLAGGVPGGGKRETCHVSECPGGLCRELYAAVCRLYRDTSFVKAGRG
jgi:hypothetical protein